MKLFRPCRPLLILLALAMPAAAQPIPAAPEQPSWYTSAQRFLPPGTVAGTTISNDEAGLVGVVAIFPASADDPATPGNAFDRGQMLEVKLQRNGGALEAVAAKLRPRGPNETADTEGFEARFKNLPPGTMPCEHGAYSIDRDPKGLNVRAAPSAQAKIVGTLPPPYSFKTKGNNVPEGGWLTEFTIIGYRDGWFLIEGAKPPGQDYEDEKVYPKNHPRPYSGRGWVARNKVGANFANGGTRIGGLFQAPHADARWTRVEGVDGDGSPDRILACSGYWALVEKSRVRGWWRSLCSNQVTNCS